MTDTCKQLNHKGTRCVLRHPHGGPCDFRLGGSQGHAWKTVQRCGCYYDAEKFLQADMFAGLPTKIRAMADGTFKAQVGKPLATTKED
ncbi:hypothetical protein LCGC14_0259390 [marine sediment metagenome]|uniref:Uncharacterized protein n=1 Tax=marine sediment metagenome TaxID=412755 RepID=A0A0F9U7A2_9ZZZZ